MGESHIFREGEMEKRSLRKEMRIWRVEIQWEKAAEEESRKRRWRRKSVAHPAPKRPLFLCVSLFSFTFWAMPWKTRRGEEPPSAAAAAMESRCWNLQLLGFGFNVDVGISPFFPSFFSSRREREREGGKRGNCCNLVEFVLCLHSFSLSFCQSLDSSRRSQISSLYFLSPDWIEARFFDSTDSVGTSVC